MFNNGFMKAEEAQKLADSALIHEEIYGDKKGKRITPSMPNWATLGVPIPKIKHIKV